MEWDLSILDNFEKDLKCVYISGGDVLYLMSIHKLLFGTIQFHPLRIEGFHFQNK